MSEAKPEASPHAWEHAALMMKATRYVEMMTSHDHDDWQYAFWSSLALELIARATLANVSPVLLADPSEWANTYFALGHTPNLKKFKPKSIGTAEVLSRLQTIYPDFKESADFCSLHTSMRNAELHSAEMPFESLRIADWQWKFYLACEILLKKFGAELEDLFSSEESAAAREHIKAAQDKAAKAVLGTVNSFSEVWKAKSQEEREKFSEQASIWASRQEGHVVICPSCACDSLIDGTPISAPRRNLDEDMVVETQAMAPSRFQCIACGLKINGLSHLIAAGIGDRFKMTATYAASDYFHPGDPDDGDWYEDDNNEPF